MLKSGGEAALVLASPAERSIHLRQRATYAIQTFGKHLRIYAHADAKVIGLLEEAAWNCRSVEIRSQPFQENINVALSQFWKRRRAPIRWHSRNGRLPRQKIAQ